VDEPLNRRDFLARTSLVPLGTAAGVIGLGLAGGSAPPPAPAQTPIPRASGAKLKTSLNAYSFARPLNDQLKKRAKGMSLFDMIDFCAEVGFDAVDPTGYFFPGYPEVPSDPLVNEFKRRAFQNGLDISGTGVRNDFASPDAAKRAGDVKHVKQWVEVAARLGAPVLRVFAGPQPEGYTWDQVASWMADSLRECAEYGRRYGVLIGVQNHGDSLKTSDQVLKIVKMVDSEWFGTIVDTGYFPPPDPYRDIARVLPHAVNFQVKEKVDGVNGNSRTDMKRLVRIVTDGGYRGYLPIETLSAKGDESDPRAGVVRLYKELRAALDAASSNA
jgi:sugar phosphate isomerase/epimerase